MFQLKVNTNTLGLFSSEYFFQEFFAKGANKEVFLLV